MENRREIEHRGTRKTSGNHSISLWGIIPLPNSCSYLPSHIIHSPHYTSSYSATILHTINGINKWFLKLDFILSSFFFLYCHLRSKAASVEGFMPGICLVSGCGGWLWGGMLIYPLQKPAGPALTSGCEVHMLLSPIPMSGLSLLLKAQNAITCAKAHDTKPRLNT